MNAGATTEGGDKNNKLSCFYPDSRIAVTIGLYFKVWHQSDTYRILSLFYFNDKLNE